MLLKQYLIKLMRIEMVQISQGEFRQWAAQGNFQQNYGEQSYPAAPNYQTNTASYGGSTATAAAAAGAGGVGDNFYHATLFDGANPAVANILQQSGLGQVVPNQ